MPIEKPTGETTELDPASILIDAAAFDRAEVNFIDEEGITSGRIMYMQLEGRHMNGEYVDLKLIFPLDDSVFPNMFITIGKEVENEQH